MPSFNETVEITRPWADWIILKQQRDVQGGGRFHIHNPLGNSNQPQGAADRNRLEVGYTDHAGQTRWGELVIHGPSGNVGLGLVNPRARLHVNGDAIVTGDIALGGADLAEDFVVAPEDDAEPGTVMVLAGEERVRSSDAPYDTRVAGVVSGAGGLTPGVVLGRREEPPRGRLALAGKVYCKVDAGPAPIGIGDLLTTAELRGHAMRALNGSRAFGAVLGKALRPLAGGQGLIPILVALQ